MSGYDRGMAARKLLVSVCAASVLAGGAVGSAESSAPCGTTPSLRLIDSEPVKLEGEGFCAGERVRVRARAGDDGASRRVRAGDDGRFRARFAALDYEPCASSLNASAWSSGELRAALKRARKLCPVPAPAPEPAEAPRQLAPPPDKCGAADATGGKPGPRQQCPPA
jgi:hypothetical protein